MFVSRIVSTVTVNDVSLPIIIRTYAVALILNAEGAGCPPGAQRYRCFLSAFSALSAVRFRFEAIG